MATTKRSKPTKKKTAPKPATRTKQTATEWAQSRIGSFRFVRLFGVADDEDDTAATVEPNDNGRWLWRVWAKPGGGDAHASGVSGRVRIAMKEADGWLTELGIAHGGIKKAHYGSGISFRDPDNIALEFFIAPGA